jgi:NAD(P)-dependent dehydrogenase (short-subunit alcohol dehydrogenase family)/ketosteroid isomerase-like protein
MNTSDHGNGPGPAARVWFITGCSSGFGQALTEAAVAAGDTVVATARHPGSLTALVARGGGRVHPLALDVTDPGAIESAVAATIDRFGRIDVLVNNAGHGSVGAVEELTLDDLRDLFEVMFFGAVELTKAVLPHMRDVGAGAVVQISSMGGQLAMPGFGAYCAAKFALEGLSEALADEVAPFGIRVVLVEPGAFRTEFGGRRMQRSRVVDAYRVSTGATRAAVDHMDGTQPGDPVKAATAILEVVDAEAPPLRLALGRDAVEAIREKHDRLRRDLETWEAVSLGTDLAIPETAHRPASRSVGDAGGSARNLATVHTYFRLQEARDLDSWIALWADDGAQAIPYAPDDFPKLVVGRTRLNEIYRSLFAGYAKLAIVDRRIDALRDPNRVLARWHTHAELSDGTTYDNDLIGLFEFDDDGKLRLLTEYFDPTPFAGITTAGDAS